MPPAAAICITSLLFRALNLILLSSSLIQIQTPGPVCKASTLVALIRSVTEHLQPAVGPFGIHFLARFLVTSTKIHRHHASFGDECFVYLKVNATSGHHVLDVLS